MSICLNVNVARKGKESRGGSKQTQVVRDTDTVHIGPSADFSGCLAQCTASAMTSCIGAKPTTVHCRQLAQIHQSVNQLTTDPIALPGKKGRGCGRCLERGRNANMSRTSFTSSVE